MPQPEINDLQPSPGPELDKMCETSNTPAAPAAGDNGAAAFDYLQEREIDALFRVIASVRDRAIFRVAYHAGLRASEVGMLQMRDYQPKATVNGMDRLFTHRLKGSHSGDHHLAREEAKALRAWLKIRGSHPGPIFCSNRGRPISRKMLDVLMKRYGELAGLPEHLRHFHVLKHTCCTHLLSKGMHVDQVQDWVGHANIQSTMIYAKVTNPRREEMARSLAAWR